MKVAAETLPESRQKASMDQHLSYDTSEVYLMYKKQIVFFTITQEEFDSAMAKSSHPIELNDSIADFYSYAYLITKRLTQTGIQAETTQRRFIKIITKNEEVLYDRKRNNKYYGVILSDGNKEPLIKEGKILTEQEYKKMLREYFNLELQE